VKSDARYDLAVRESAEPIQPGEWLTYKLSYGYRQAAPVIANATLRMHLAPGTSFISASGDGVLIGDSVEWDLGTLNPGDGGFRELTVQVDAGDASVLQAAAQIFDSDNPVQQSAWQAHTTVDATTPIGVQIDVNADPARPNELLNAQFIVTNRDSVARIVTLRGRYPQGLNSVAISNAGWNTPASCSPSFCDPTNLVTWSFGSIPAGQSVTLRIRWNGALVSPEGGPLASKRLAYVGNEGSYLMYAARWFPFHDYAADRATSDITIIVPTGTQVGGISDEPVNPQVDKTGTTRFRFVTKQPQLVGNFIAGQYIVTLHTTEPAAVSPSRSRSAPRATASRYTRLSGPACGTSAEWNSSAPPRGARHWKNSTPCEPRATAARLCRAIRPGSLVCIRSVVWMRFGAVSISSQPGPPGLRRAQPRARSAANAACSSAPAPGSEG